MAERGLSHEQLNEWEALERIDPSDMNTLLETLALLGANLATAFGAKGVKLDQFKVKKSQAKPVRQSTRSMKANLCAIVAANNSAFR